MIFPIGLDMYDRHLAGSELDELGKIITEGGSRLSLCRGGIAE